MIMKLYVIFWIALALCTISSTMLVSIDSKLQYQKHNKVPRMRIMTAASTFIGLLYFVSSTLEIIMLYAYYRMSQKMTSTETKLVARSLYDDDNQSNLEVYRDQASEAIESLMVPMMTLKVQS